MGFHISIIEGDVMSKIIKTMGIDYGNGNSVTRVQTTNEATDYEYKVVVWRDGIPYSELECDEDFMMYNREYRNQRKIMEEYLASKPKQGEFEL